MYGNGLSDSISSAISTFWVVGGIASFISLVYWLVVANYWGRTAANTERCVTLLERVIVLLGPRLSVPDIASPPPSNFPVTAEASLNCPKCGYSLNSDAKYCPKCGRSIY
jgi:hypothetical protein